MKAVAIHPYYLRGLSFILGPTDLGEPKTTSESDEDGESNDSVNADESKSGDNNGTDPKEGAEELSSDPEESTTPPDE